VRQLPIDLVSRQQAALRRVAALIAGAPESSEVFAAVAREVAQVTGSALVQIQRFEPDDTVTVAGAWGDRPHPFQPGTKWSLEGSQIASAIKRTGQVVRIDDFGQGAGQIQAGVRKTGIRGGAGAPIVVAGEVWGAMAAGPAPGEPVPRGLEETLAEFTQLVATAIANTESRAALARLAEEQAALRRVATLVAENVSPDGLFDHIVEEVGVLLGVDAVGMGRFDPGDMVTTLAMWSAAGDPTFPPERVPLQPGGLTQTIARTREAARIDDWSDREGIPATVVRDQMGMRSSVGVPINVEGDVWGTIAVHSKADVLPSDTESRLERFADLVVTGLTNANARGEVRRLANEQAALRRVATLVAEEATPDEVFSAVAEEIGRLLGIEDTGMVRYEADETATVVASAGGLNDPELVGTRLPLGGTNVTTEVWQTGRAARIDDHSESSGEVGTYVRGVGARATVGSPIVVDGRLWGAMLVTSATGELPAATEARVGEFTELVATAISNTEARAQVQRLVDEQAALRRVAMMIAQAAPADDLFANVVEEAGKLLGADAAGLGRNLDDKTMEPLAMWAAGGDHPPVTPRTELEPHSLAGTIARTREPGRIDDWSGHDSSNAALIRDKLGARSSVGVPIEIDDELWGLIVIHSKTVFPPDTESRLQRFADLVATGLSNAQARREVRRLADEQAALRRVATLVAHEATPEQVFSAVADELARLLAVDDTGMVRYEPDETAAVVGSASRLNGDELLGRRLPLGGDNVLTRVYRTGRAARIDDHSEWTGEIGDYARGVGSRSTVGSPVIVDGRLWGAMLVTSASGILPPDTGERVAEFTELVATAIANVEAREDLAASRARLVAAADDERRRVVRDLHDGAQQRLVHTVVTLKLADRALADDREDARTLVANALENAENANAELRELAQGIMPGVLTRGGLRAGVDSLASRMSIPVEVEVPDRRLPPAVEATAYFVVAEALTNIVKHARARTAVIAARVQNGRLHVEVRDDGEGGARPDGSGLIGLRDRVAALDGDLVVDSEAGAGTRVAATIPLADGPAA
jgi:GAF domain-containing protein